MIPASTTYLLQERFLSSRTKGYSRYKPKVSPNTYANLKQNDTQCLLHKRPHTLQKCCTITKEPLEECQTSLRERERNFCLDVVHLPHIMQKKTKNYMDRVGWIECDSEKHSTALHSGPAPWPKEVDHVSKHGWGCRYGTSHRCNIQMTRSYWCLQHL